MKRRETGAFLFGRKKFHKTAANNVLHVKALKNYWGGIIKYR
ncbi:hypothetical protein PEPNEM18_01147 [Aedoeadaptatus nemausensis]|uniref:Uncharacterized protein n=1 Tax=Aedoeadaptatus nemausensis TaxID=2582829 RepID=A0A6V6Y4P9_9FIRM|nr:hypothetical protein PEPNEM18_01147 [Peptoniphilus nemausensis]